MNIRLCHISIINALLLSACADKEEAIDQTGHFAQGYAMACDLSRWADADVAVETVMDYARAREDLQHPGVCLPGCQQDLRHWEKGAMAGAQCKVGE